MSKKVWHLLVLFVITTLLLCACGTEEKTGSSETENDDTVLTWNTWNNYEKYEPFLNLLSETYPEIKIEFVPYSGGNGTEYSWIQMRSDDTADIFLTSQILDQDLAKERLIDLSGYDFINDFSNSLLDQVSIDGGVYMLPVSNTIYGLFYNKTLMEKHGWELPTNYKELKNLCGEIKKEGLIPGVACTYLTGGPFSNVFNLAKTDWLTTPKGVEWEHDFLAGKATAAGNWENTMDYVQQYIDLGMFHTDSDDRSSREVLTDYLGQGKAVFGASVHNISKTDLEEIGDEIGLMPYISKDGSKNVYMYTLNSYFGISKRLTEPGNEKKLENAIKFLSLLFSEEGQATLISEEHPCVIGVLNNAVEEDSMIYDAWHAMQEGRAFPMTYAGWENVLAEMGQAYKEWFRGENGMNGTKCIARMDELQQDYLKNKENLNFCESTENFTLEETATLVGKALGSTVGADAVMVPLGEFHDGVEINSAISGKLYAGKIDPNVFTTIIPNYDGEYSLLTMTGAQAKELAAAGFDAQGDGNPFPYILVTKGGGELDDDSTYQVAFLMEGYTEEVGKTYNAEVKKGSLRAYLRSWLEEQKVVSPEGNPWE